jgi:hypothetical protein
MDEEDRAAPVHLGIDRLELGFATDRLRQIMCMLTPTQPN